MYQKGNYYRNKRYYTNKGLTLQKKPKDPPKIIDNYYIPIYRNYFLESGQLMERTTIVTMKFKLQTSRVTLGTLINNKIVAAGKTLNDIKAIGIQPEITLLNWEFPSSSTTGNQKDLYNVISATDGSDTWVSNAGYSARITNNSTYVSSINVFANYEILIERDDPQAALWDMSISKGEFRINQTGGSWTLQDNITNNQFTNTETLKTFTNREYTEETNEKTGLTSQNPFNLYIYGRYDSNYYLTYEFTVNFF